MSQPMREKWHDMLRRSFHPIQWFSEDRPLDIESDSSREEKVMYVYKRMGKGFSVGHYDPRGEWIPESLYDDPKDAANRVHWLNGGQL